MEFSVVTGSTDGIGKAYAKELASRGINLILISRTLARLENTRNEILEINPKIQVRIIVADFSKGREVAKDIAKKLEDVPIGILGKTQHLLLNMKRLNFFESMIDKNDEASE